LKDKEKESLIKQKQIKIRNKTASKKPDISKPKMVDACTQTDRSDFAIIKYKMQKQKQKLKMETKSFEKNKLNMIMNRKPSGAHSEVRASNLNSHESLITKMSTFKGANGSANKKHVPLMNHGIKHYSKMPLKMGLAKSENRHGPDSAKSQVTPGFSRNPIKAPAKRTMLHMGKKKKYHKMRLPSLQGKREK